MSKTDPPDFGTRQAARHFRDLRENKTINLERRRALASWLLRQCSDRHPTMSPAAAAYCQADAHAIAARLFPDFEGSDHARLGMAIGYFRGYIACADSI